MTSIVTPIDANLSGLFVMGEVVGEGGFGVVFNGMERHSKVVVAAQAIVLTFEQISLARVCSKYVSNYAKHS